MLFPGHVGFVIPINSSVPSNRLIVTRKRDEVRIRDTVLVYFIYLHFSDILLLVLAKILKGLIKL